VLEAVFILLEFPSPSRRNFIGSHSLPPLWFTVSVLQGHKRVCVKTQKTKQKDEALVAAKRPWRLVFINIRHHGGTLLQLQDLGPLQELLHSQHPNHEVWQKGWGSGHPQAVSCPLSFLLWPIEYMDASLVYPLGCNACSLHCSSATMGFFAVEPYSLEAFSSNQKLWRAETFSSLVAWEAKQKRMRSQKLEADYS
jgi:hypothetical protein